MPLEEIGRFLDVDSLAYIGLDQLKAAVGGDAGWCDACLTGRYPTAVPVELAGVATPQEAMRVVEPVLEAARREG